MSVVNSESQFDAERLRRGYRKIDECIDARNRNVASVVRVIPGPRAEGFGSAFFYMKAGRPFLVTAWHVAEEIAACNQLGQESFLVVRGRKEIVRLSRTEFFFSKEMDLAIAPLWKLQDTDLSHIDFFEDSNCHLPLVMKGLFAFTGFPVSRNKTYTGLEMKLYQRVITFSEPTERGIDESSLFCFFPLDHKKIHDSELQSTQMKFPDGLNGMSGGPVYAIRGSIDEPELCICGIGVAWLPNHSLKVLRFDVVDAWLSEYFNARIF